MMSVGRICTRSLDLADTEEAVQAVARRMLGRKVVTLVDVSVLTDPMGRPLTTERTSRPR
jgi:hypothetical protein